MEVGAVKQAFNNEVILLKKKLNQAKIQIIHKLTRKAKTLIEKKVPEKLKIKFTKKAESAVKEVLLIKKIKAMDVAKFIVTHKGQLNEYLNRPAVDQDKACARLLLHKALQDKYKNIRERFLNISIKDLFMSRLERRKLKKEAREEQMNKKKGKDVKKPVQAEADWNVEDLDVHDSHLNPPDNDMKSSGDEYDQNDDKDDESDSETSNNNVVKANVLLNNNISSGVDDGSNKESNESNDEDKLHDEYENLNDDNKMDDDSNKESSESNEEVESDDESENFNDLPKDCESEESDKCDNTGEEESARKLVNVASCLPSDNMIVKNKNEIKNIPQSKDNIKNYIQKKHKDHNKNKNLKNKILSKTFNKEKSEIPQENKVVDPFFITATGESYMSVAEPRPPDEVKEVHKQGNRQYRRAVMFGHVPKTKSKRHGFRNDTNNSRFSKFNDHNREGSFNNHFKSNNSDKYGPHKRFDKSIDHNTSNLNDRINYNKKSEDELKPEKLHPSWEAKKRQSGILPFQGKKTVFEES